MNGEIKKENKQVFLKTKIAAFLMLIINLPLAVVTSIAGILEKDLTFFVFVIIYLAQVILAFFLLKKSKKAWIISVFLLSFFSIIYLLTLVIMFLYFLSSRPVADPMFALTFILFFWVISLILLLLDRNLYLTQKRSSFFAKILLVIVIFLSSSLVLLIGLSFHYEVFWDGYTNKEYGYKINYPKGWELKEYSPESVFIYSKEADFEEESINILFGKKDDFYEGNMLFLINKDIQKTIEERNNFLDFSEEKYTIDEREGTKTTIHLSEGEKFVFIFIPNFKKEKDMGIMIMFISPEIFKEAEEIISTIKTF